MYMNVHHLRRTFTSSLLVALPGAVLSTFLLAACCKTLLLYDWSWELCYLIGAILCTTDSVAVVSVLKDKGAAPSLSVFLIQAALLNDGTALILFQIFLNALLKERDDYYIGEVSITLYIVKVLCLSPLIGIALGIATILTFRITNKHLLESDTIVQISSSLSCAYLSFYWSEGVLKLNGVLSCVSSGVVISLMGSTLILEPHTMKSVWEVITWVSNTLIFLLAGLLFGNIHFSPHW